MIAHEQEYTEPEIRRYEEGYPQAHVVRIVNAQHMMFRSNPDDVERELNNFTGSLPHRTAKLAATMAPKWRYNSCVSLMNLAACSILVKTHYSEGNFQAILIAKRSVGGMAL